MPKYGLSKYSTFKYGRYKLVSNDGGLTLSQHVRYRIRTHPASGSPSPFITMYRDTIGLPSDVQTRIRASNGEWVYTQRAVINDDAFRIRIRAVNQNGEASPWAYGERGNLSKL